MRLSKTMTPIEQLNFSFVIPSKLAGMSIPGRYRDIREDIKFLKSKKVSLIVNLTGKSYGSDLFHNEFKVINSPIEDFGVPTTTQVEQIWEIYQSLTPDNIMSVHCHMGIGRTGLVLACLYGREFNLSGKEAIAKIRSLRESIETEGQENFVKTFLQ
jgi:protein-tyrosine phosphatase